MPKSKFCYPINQHYSNIIVTQIGEGSMDSKYTDDHQHEQVILNAIQTSYCFYMKMISLELYVGNNNEHCVVFKCVKKDDGDPYPNTTSIYWSYDHEISMINEDWIDIWHLKQEYLQLMKHYKEKFDLSNEIDDWIKKAFQDEK